MRKYLDVSVVEFLQKVVDKNTETYQEDFEIDKVIFSEVADGGRLEGNVWLWMSRQHGTQCMSEQEVFVKDSPAYSTWCYYDNDFASEKVKAFAVEVNDAKDGVVYGNVYELDYKAHVADVRRCAVETGMVHKVFQDGYVDQVSPERSCYGYYAGLVEEHGAIVDSLWAPKDEGKLADVLRIQKQSRDRLRVGEYVRDTPDVDKLIADAKQISAATQGESGKSHVERELC